MRSVARHDYLDSCYSSDGKTIVATDPGWDEERLSSSEYGVEDIKVDSLQVQFFMSCCLKVRMSIWVIMNWQRFGLCWGWRWRRQS